MSEAVGHAELRRDNGAVATRSEHPEIGHAGAARRGVEPRIGMIRRKATSFAGQSLRILEELGQQFDLLRKDTDIIGLRAGLQRTRGA